MSLDAPDPIKPITDQEKEIACMLACRALRLTGKAKFTVRSQLDIEKPKTIENWAIFEEILFDAYMAGAAAEKAAQTARDVDREHDEQERT